MRPHVVEGASPIILSANCTARVSSIGQPTALKSEYDNSRRTAKARAGGSHGAKPKPKIKREPEVVTGNEEDAEGETDPEFEPMNQPGGSQRLPAATLTEKDDDVDVYIDEGQSSPPAAQQAGGTHPSERQAAPLTGMPEGHQTPLGYASCCGTKRPSSALEDSPVLSIGLKRALEEAEAQRPSPGHIMDTEYYVDLFEVLHEQGLEKDQPADRSWYESDFGPLPGLEVLNSQID